MNFLNTISAYCEELSPVVGPLLQHIAATAAAVHKASLTDSHHYGVDTKSIDGVVITDDFN